MSECREQQCRLPDDRVIVDVDLLLLHSTTAGSSTADEGRQTISFKTLDRQLAECGSGIRLADYGSEISVPERVLVILVVVLVVPVAVLVVPKPLGTATDHWRFQRSPGNRFRMVVFHDFW